MMRHCAQTCRCRLGHFVNKVSGGLQCGKSPTGQQRVLGQPFLSIAGSQRSIDGFHCAWPLRAMSPVMEPRADPAVGPPPLAYEIIQGALVRGCAFDSCSSPPPTVVLVHGILGSKRNLVRFAKRLMEGFPSWQAVLVDLRCHGASANLHSHGPHGVETSGRDVLELLSYLKIFPRVLIGHSFGGKVVMSMAQQFGQRLPRPVQVWVLDALPGEVRSGEEGRKDHPFDLIQTLKEMVIPLPSRHHLIDSLVNSGYSRGVASWMTTNLRTMETPGNQALTFTFNLDGVEEMYRSYETTNLWPLLANPPEGLKLDFVRAERSNYRWGGEDSKQIEAFGHGVHLLRNSGHWVHSDNPDGLFDIIESSMGTADLHMRRSERDPV